MAKRKALGNWGEKYAATFLEQKGYQLLKKNWRCQAGEMDLILLDNSTLVFVEVKTRRGRGSGSPEAAISPHKLERLFSIIEHYLLVEDLAEDSDWRLDMVAVELTPAGDFLRCEHWQALGADW